jgi:alpha-1,2-mannosyltransferase
MSTTSEPAARLFEDRRMRVYPRIFIAVYVLAALVLVLFSSHMVDRSGKPIGYDFIAFWAASHLTLDNRPEAAFDDRSMAAAEQLAVPGITTLFRWFYPPTYQLATAPFALLPYAAAYVLFIMLSLICFLLTVSRLLDQPERMLLLLAFPGTFICVMQGQNSLLTASVFAGAIICLPRRPLAAGLLFGLLILKPQFGVFIPLALVASGQWRAFGAAALTVIVLVLASMAVFGIDLWQAFFAHMRDALMRIDSGLKPWPKMPTAFVFFRLPGLPGPLAHVLQGIATAGAAGTVILVWRRCGASLLAGAVLVSATLVGLPYVFDNEMAVLAVPLAILATNLARRGGADWERGLLLAICLSPLAMVAAATWMHLQIGFPALVATLFLAVRRALAIGPIRESKEQGALGVPS